MNELFNAPRAEQILREANIDALVAALPENWLYLTGLEDSVASTIGLPTVALVTRRPLALHAIAIPRLIAGFAAASVRQVNDVVLYGEFPIASASPAVHDLDRDTHRLLEQDNHAMASVADAVETMLRRAFVHGARVAVDEPSIGAIIAERLPDCTVVPGRKVFEKIRAVKTSAEIARLTRAVRVVEEMEALAFEHIVPGKVWDDFVPTMPSLAASRGARFGFFSGGSGWRSGYLFPPVEEPLRRGDLVRLDITVSSHGYWADTGRTACLGAPDDLTSKRYGAIRSAVQAAIEAIRPGQSLAHIYEVTMEQARKQLPDYQRRHCGHTIGLRPYDGLLVAPDEPTTLQPSMVLNIEVPYYGIGWGGLQLEETVVVTPDGCRALTEMSRDLVEVPA